MDDRVRAGDDLVALAEIGQVGQDALAVGGAVMGDVDVEHLVAGVAQVAHHPSTRLAAAAGHDDPHRTPP